MNGGASVTNIYCLYCKHPRAAITSNEVPVQPRFLRSNGNLGLRCGVCGSYDIIATQEKEPDDDDTDPGRDERIKELAKEQWHRDGECEIDDNAVISEGDDNGTYVQA